jgi:hypothetical protein
MRTRRYRKRGGAEGEGVGFIEKIKKGVSDVQSQFNNVGSNFTQGISDVQSQFNNVGLKLTQGVPNVDSQINTGSVTPEKKGLFGFGGKRRSKRSKKKRSRR